MIEGEELQFIPFLKGVSQEHIALLAEKFERCEFPAQEMIFAQGDPAVHLYILRRGEVAIRFKPYDGEALTVSVIKPGGVFGWSAALGRHRYTSGALCTEESEVYRIRGADLHKLCLDHPQTGVVILERLATVIAERLRNTHEQVIKMLWQGVNSHNSR
jgi:CRP-like cAMP-binding protein